MSIVWLNVFLMCVFVCTQQNPQCQINTAGCLYAVLYPSPVSSPSF